MGNTVTAAEVEESIKGIKFPAKREDLVNQAEKNESKEDVIKILKDLPDEEYKSPIDVAKAFGGEK